MRKWFDNKRKEDPEYVERKLAYHREYMYEWNKKRNAENKNLRAELTALKKSLLLIAGN